MLNTIAIAADDSCPLCGYWDCRCGKAQAGRCAVLAVATDSDPDMDEAPRRARAGK